MYLFFLNLEMCYPDACNVVLDQYGIHEDWNFEGMKWTMSYAVGEVSALLSTEGWIVTVIVAIATTGKWQKLPFRLLMIYAKTTSNVKDIVLQCHMYDFRTTWNKNHTLTKQTNLKRTCFNWMIL